MNYLRKMQTYLLSIYVSSEQEEAIKELFHDRCWQFQKTEFLKTKLDKGCIHDEGKEEITEEEYEEDLTEDDAFTNELSRENTIEYFDVDKIEKLIENKSITDKKRGKSLEENKTGNDVDNRCDIGPGLNNFQLQNTLPSNTFSDDSEKKDKLGLGITDHLLTEGNRIVNTSSHECHNRHLKPYCIEPTIYENDRPLHSFSNPAIGSLKINSLTNKKDKGQSQKEKEKQTTLKNNKEQEKLSSLVNITESSRNTVNNSINNAGNYQSDDRDLKAKSVKPRIENTAQNENENTKEFTKLKKSRKCDRKRINRKEGKKVNDLKRKFTSDSKLQSINVNNGNKSFEIGKETLTYRPDPIDSLRGIQVKRALINKPHKVIQTSVQRGTSARLTSRRLLQKISRNSEKLKKQRQNRSLIREKVKNKGRPLKSEKAKVQKLQGQKIKTKDLKAELKGAQKSNLNSAHLIDRHRLPIKEDGKHYKCNYCKRLFLNELPYLKHVDQHMKSAFDCPDCGKKFSSVRNLNSHKYNRSKQRHFVCDICDFEAHTACVLRTHKKKTHPPEETFQCHLCAKIVKTKSYLNVHLKYAHKIDEGKYECPFCSHKSKRPKLFAKHVKQHLEEKNEYVDRTCVICGKICETKLQLNNHKRVHCEKKYLCDFCGKGFITRSKLQAHNRTHTGVKPYECHLCDYKSTQAGNLRLHMKVHQKENAKENEIEESSSNFDAHVKEIETHLTSNEPKLDLPTPFQASILQSSVVPSSVGLSSLRPAPVLPAGSEGAVSAGVLPSSTYQAPVALAPVLPAGSTGAVSAGVLPSSTLQAPVASAPVLPFCNSATVLPSSTLQAPVASAPVLPAGSAGAVSAGVLPSSTLQAPVASAPVLPTGTTGAVSAGVLPSSTLQAPVASAPALPVFNSATVLPSSTLQSPVVSAPALPFCNSATVLSSSTLQAPVASEPALPACNTRTGTTDTSSSPVATVPVLPTGSAGAVSSGVLPSSSLQSPVASASVLPAANHADGLLSSVLPAPVLPVQKKLPSYSEFLESTNKKCLQLHNVPNSFGQSFQSDRNQDVSSFVELKSSSSKEHNLINSDIQTTMHQSIDQSNFSLTHHYSLLENTHPMEVTESVKPTTTPLPEVNTLSKNIKPRPVQSQTLYASEHAEHVPMHMIADTSELQPSVLSHYDQSSVHSQYDSQFSSLAEAMYASQQTDDYTDSNHLNTVYPQSDIYGISRSDLENVAQVYQNTFGFDYVSTVQSIYDSSHPMNENQSSNYSNQGNRDQCMAHHGKTDYDQLNQGHLSLDQTADLGKYSQQKLDYVATATTSVSDLEYCKQGKDQPILTHSMDYGQVPSMNDAQSQYMQSSLMGSLQQTHAGVNSQQFYPHAEHASLANVGMNTQMPLQGSEDASKMYQYPSYS